MVNMRYRVQEVHPGDLKKAVTNYLNQLLQPVRDEFNNDEAQQLIAQAYPKPSSTAHQNMGIVSIVLHYLMSLSVNRESTEGRRDSSVST